MDLTELGVPLPRVCGTKTLLDLAGYLNLYDIINYFELRGTTAYELCPIRDWWGDLKHVLADENSASIVRHTDHILAALLRLKSLNEYYFDMIVFDVLRASEKID